MPAAAVTQFSGGSSQANEDLIKAMGKAAELVDKLPGAKPHAKKGTGKGGGGRHQARNARVINKAKQDTAKAHQDPTMFSSSRMRTADASHREKDRQAEEGRSERKAAGKAAKDAEIRAALGLDEGEELTSAHRKEYKALEKAIGGGSRED
jgi:hypothetical protein